MKNIVTGVACVDCKHCADPISILYGFNTKCLKYKIKTENERDLYGFGVSEVPLNITACRKDEDMCGRIGRGFEKKEEGIFDKIDMVYISDKLILLFFISLLFGLFISMVNT